MTDKPRLIEFAFPLKQASIDSVHEKNVRHGHISTLHIWPARRPLAACRAALIATLLPDPGDPEKRKELVEKIGGRIIEKIEKKKLPSGRVVEVKKEETIGGILHWGRETENRDVIDWFRNEIKKEYGGRAPKVLDPFAGGGAIPLEAMRLGCDVTAIDINPVAWFILKCTLEYPQKLAGQKGPLPEFILKDKEFMEGFFKSQGFKGALLRTQLERLGHGENPSPELKGLESKDALLEADLAWHVRAWGNWVLSQARKELAKYYPTYADFQPLKPSGKVLEKQESKFVPLKEDGIPDIDHLNIEFTKEYLEDPKNPRWIAKPAVAYLWARIVKCKNCSAFIPLLKTRWLCKRNQKRVVLTMESNAENTGVMFGVQHNVPVKGGNAAQRRENDKRIGAGTMSRSGAQCPCCNSIMTMEDIRLEGQADRLGAVMTSVVVDGLHGKEYRMPTEKEKSAAEEARSDVDRVFADIPFGMPSEATPKGGSGASRAFSVDGYGFDQWHKLFTQRQLVALGTLIRLIHRICAELSIKKYSDDWRQGIYLYLSCGFDRMLDFNSQEVAWITSVEAIGHTFVRYALPITWDYSESAIINYVRGGWQMSLEAVSEAMQTILKAGDNGLRTPGILRKSAKEKPMKNEYDVIVTDPPYYDAIPYSDLMDYFYIWNRRCLMGISEIFKESFSNELNPKWDSAAEDGELIDDSARFDGDKVKSKEAYEKGMAEVFIGAFESLRQNGRFVIVFAHKNPDAWETLVGAIIKAGFVVDGSWPIRTEQAARMRAQSSAALSSSVWLVCKKRADPSRPGWDNVVLEEMRMNISKRLREYWDAGIRGPDFVWAATGPALEAYSKHPVVKKANDPGKLMEVAEFLRHVRRMVVDFVVGRVLTQKGEEEAVSGLDDVTTYYLLHRHDFGMEDAPAGPCILYAVSCGLTDGSLADQFDILQRTGGKSKEAEEDDEEERENEEPEEVEEGTGSTLKLKPWYQRKRPSMGYDPAIDSAKARVASANLSLFPDMKPEQGMRREIPLIDQVHRLMHLWKAGEVVKVDDYLDSRALLRNHTFHHVLQALIELALAGSEERSILESISNHLKSRGVTVEDLQPGLI